MKVLAILLLCAFAAATPHTNHKVQHFDVSALNIPAEPSADSRNFLVNALIRQLIAFIRRVINNGSDLLGVPPLDPLHLENIHLDLPLGLINMNLEIKDGVATGIGGFEVHKSDLNLSDLSFDIDISVPRITVACDLYNLSGDILTAIPIYGFGKAEFVVENFRLRGKLMLKQSADGNSVIIDKIVDAGFELPHFTSDITGAIGGGDIDHIVNAVIEEVIVDYIRRFHGAVVNVATNLIITHGNPILEQLDTWKYLEPLM